MMGRRRLRRSKWNCHACCQANESKTHDGALAADGLFGSLGGSAALAPGGPAHGSGRQGSLAILRSPPQGPVARRPHGAYFYVARHDCSVNCPSPVPTLSGTALTRIKVRRTTASGPKDFEAGGCMGGW